MDIVTLNLAKQYANSVAGTGGGGSSGDMLKSVYDTDNNGIVDNSERLGGQLPDYYATTEDIPQNISELNNDMNFQTDVQVNDKINSKLTSVYRSQGSILFENLPELTADKEGFVYNISNAFTTDERFVEGAGLEYPAGANIVVVNIDDTYKLSSLAGTFDLSNLQEKILGKRGQFVGFVNDNEVGAISSSPTGGVKTCRFVIGTSTAGWTTADCDYLCDGVDDQEEINQAIQTIPETGGEIHILSGVYNITASIVIDKERVTFSGNSQSTIFKRMWIGSSVSDAVITFSKGLISFKDFEIDGSRDVYTVGNGLYAVEKNLTDILLSNISSYENANYGINVENAKKVTSENVRVFNNGQGIRLAYAQKSKITGTYCYDNKYSGIDLVFARDIIVVENYSHDSGYNINAGAAKNIIIIGNSCFNGEGISSDYTSSQHTIYLASASSNCIVIGNNCAGKAPTVAGTNNIVENNLS